MPLKEPASLHWEHGLRAVISEAAERRVRVSGLCRLTGSGRRTMILENIFVPPEDRGWGIGSSVIRDVLAWADQASVTVRLTPDAAFSGMSLSRLERFWRSFGFVPNTGANGDPAFKESLVRAPMPMGDLEIRDLAENIDPITQLPGKPLPSGWGGIGPFYAAGSGGL